jgi:hypothetical protein
MAQKVLMNGIADAGTARLALLLGEPIELPLQLGLHPHADHHRLSRETIRSTV